MGDRQFTSKDIQALLIQNEGARQRVEEMKKVPAQYMLGGGWLALNLAGP